MGRTFVETVEYSYLATDSVEVEFTETTFADFYNFDHFGHENIGKPVELSGFLHRNLYITDGYERVYILCTSVDRSSLNNYIGYNVVIKGFYFGNDVNPYIAITNVSSYDPIIEYGEHTDTEKVKKALDDLINDTRYYEYGFEGGEEISTIQSHDIFDECEYIYSIIGDSPAYIEDGVIYFVDANENYQVKVQVEIKCGDASSFYEFNLYVRGYDLDSLDDLFLEEPGTKEIHLVGEVLQIANSYIYLVIEGKVYYLEYDYQYNFYEGDLVHVSGQKSIIDGKVNYSYNIYLDNYYDDYDYLEPEIVVKTISQLYEDPDGDDIKGYIIRVSGTLLYDVHNDTFYLEEEDQRIYIRESYTGDGMYEKAKVSSRYYVDNKTYIDEEVYLYLLFPDKKIYGECILFDLYNIEMQEMTLEEHIEHAMNDIKRNVENMVFHIGDYVLDAIEPKMIHEDEYYLNCTFDLKNEEDSIYFSEDLNQISIVEVETYVTIIITLYYWDKPSISREFEVDLHLIPYEQSSIHDVLYGVPYEYYMIEGTVQKYNLDRFIILKDDTGVIYVDIMLPEDYEIAVGDKFVVYGFRDFYEYSNETPILVSYGVAKNKGAGDPVNNVPEIIDIDGIKAIEYLEPNQHLKYVTFTGKVIFTGNYAYPAHSILENEDMPDLLLGLEGPTYWEFNDMMEENQGKTVRVTGWLMLKSTYSEFMWDLIYDYHVVLDDNN